MEKRTCPKCGLVDWSTTIVCKRCGLSFDPQNAATGEVGNVSQPRRAVSETNPTGPHQVSRPDVTREGWKKIKGGAMTTGVYVIFILGIIIGDFEFRRIIPFALVVGLAPVAWLLAGVLEIATGVPFSQMSRRWDDLAGWQRGVIGISVFVAGLVALAIVCFVILVTLDTAQGIKR